MWYAGKLDETNKGLAAQVRAAMRGPQCPANFAHLMRWFYELSNSREWIDGYPTPLRPSEVEAWARLTRTEITAAEARLLFAIDVTYRNVHAEDDGDCDRLPDHDQIMLAWSKSARQAKAAARSSKGNL